LLQIRPQEQQNGQGSGLGLALCKDFVERGHGGQIGFESSPALGTSFFFEIEFTYGISHDVLFKPKSLWSEATTVTKSHSNDSLLSSNALTSDDLQHQQVDVVIVDDSVVTRKLLAKTMSNLGFSHRTFENGQEVSRLEQSSTS
jgi:hypothetical protein